MANLYGLNQKALNAGSKLALVSASLSWSVSGVAGFSAPSITHACAIDFDASTLGMFGLHQEKFARFSTTTSSELQLKGNKQLSLTSQWATDTHFTCYIVRQVNTSIGFDILSDCLIIPDAVFGQLTPTVVSDLSLAPTLVQPLEVSWSGTGEETYSESTVTRHVVGDWTVTGEAFFDGHLDTGGALTYDGYFFPEVQANWEFDVSQVKTFVNGTLWRSDNSFTMDAIHYSPMAMSLTSEWTSSFHAGINYQGALSAHTTFTTDLVATSLLVGHIPLSSDISAQWVGNVTHSGHWAPASNSTMSLQPTHTAALHMAVSSASAFSSEGVATRYVHLPVVIGVDWQADGFVYIPAEANWFGLGGWFGATAIVELEPASIERRFIIQPQLRQFDVQKTGREFKVS